MKRIISLLIVLCMAFSLVACGSSDTANEETKEEPIEDVEEKVSLTTTDLETLCEETLSNCEEWTSYGGAGHVYYENDDELEDIDGRTYFPIVDDNFVSVADVENMLLNYYSKSAVQSYLDRGTLADIDGKLYTQVYGIGGVISNPAYKVEATLNDVGTYTTVIYYSSVDDSWAPTYETESTAETTIIYENGKYVFNDLVFFGYFVDSPEFIVNN